MNRLNLEHITGNLYVTLGTRNKVLKIDKKFYLIGEEGGR